MPALIELLGGIVPALALLGACLGWMVASGSIHIWDATFHKVFAWAASILPGGFKIIGGIHFPDLAGIVRSADVAVQDYLKVWRRGAELEIALSIHLLKLVWQAQAEAVDWVARETAATFDHVIHIRVPKVVKYAVPFALTPLILRKIVQAVLPHIRVGTVRIVHTVEHTVAHTTTTIIRKSIPAVIPYPHVIPRIEREIVGLTRRNLRINHRLHRLEGLFAASVMAAAMANVLGLPNWRCLTRGNIGRAARHFCGLDRWLVDFLLLGSVEAFIASDLCEFSDLLIKQAEVLRPALMELVDVEDALIGCHGTTKPLLFKLPVATLPPLQGVSPLAA